MVQIRIVGSKNSKYIFVFVSMYILHFSILSANYKFFKCHMVFSWP